MPERGYFQTELNESFYLSVGDGHELYVEICGNTHGLPVVFLHGGPGSNISEKCRWFFDPEKYRIILFDQRGTGKSKPFLCLENNTPFATVDDIEALRKYLGIEKWIVFGGSYGSTLGLVYGILHPERIMHLVLRGIFFGRTEDIEWLFQNGASNIYPEEFEEFKNFIASEKQNDLVTAYYQIMTGNDTDQSRQACKHWADWENGLLRIVNDPVQSEILPSDISAGLLESYYFINKMFWPEDNYILNHANQLTKIPVDIFHGRFDMDCRVKGAYELKQVCPHANLQIVQTGSHYPYDSPIFDLLIQKMDEIANIY